MTTILKFPERKNLDCQGESNLVSALKGSVQLLNPGIDLDDLARKKAAYAKRQRVITAKNMIAEGFETMAVEVGLDAAYEHLEHLLNGTKAS